MRSLLILLSLSLPAFALDGTTHRSEIGSHVWTDTGAWNTDTLPGDQDPVFLPGWVGQGTLTIPAQASVRAGSLRIGSQAGAIGRLDVKQGTLSLTRSRIDGVLDAGRIYVGVDGGTGLVNQVGGIVLAAKAIRIGDGGTSSGRYVLSAGTLHAGSGIVLTRGLQSKGVLEIVGSGGAIATKAYTHGNGDAVLRVIADAQGITPVTAHTVVNLSGTLEVDLSRLAGRPDQIVVIDNRGTQAIRGGFGQVKILDSGYSVDYSGGDGNDVVLTRVQDSLLEIEPWAAHFLPNQPLSRTTLQKDDDNDGISNLAEYKLGSLPDYNEGLDVTPRKSAGRYRVRYSELINREDAAIYPQVQVDGRWRSDKLRVEVISESAGSRVMEASFRGQPRPFRLAAELLPDKTKPMNVMLFIVDDLNDWVGCLGGHPQASTPHIDSLASRGVLFTNAHSNGVTCNVSRASFLTGVYPSTSGIYYNRQRYRISPSLENVKTLPEHFQANGYTTGKAGKVFHRESTTDMWDTLAPLRADSERVTNPDPPKTVGNDGILDWSGIDRPDEEFFDHKVGSWIIDQLGNQTGERPYFLTAGLYLPHVPWYAPKRFFDRLSIDEIVTPPRKEDDLADLPKVVFESIVNFENDSEVVGGGLWKDAVHAYLATTSFSDAQVGRVLAAMDERLDRRNTIIALVSDHGFHLGEKLHWRKRTLWQESSRVPMMIVAPGVTKPGSQIAQAVSLIDLYPTLAELTSTEAPAHLEGTSLASILADVKSAKNTLALTTRRYRQHSLRDNRYTYIRYASGREEFYDRSVDPNEWNNLGEDPSMFILRRRFRRRLPKLNVRPIPVD